MDQYPESKESGGFTLEDVLMLSCLLLLAWLFVIEFVRILQTQISDCGYDAQDFTNEKKRVKNRYKCWSDGLQRVHQMKPKRRPKTLSPCIKLFVSYLRHRKTTPAAIATPTLENYFQKPKKKASGKGQVKELSNRKKQPANGKYGPGLSFRSFGVRIHPCLSRADFDLQNTKRRPPKTSPSAEPDAPIEVLIEETQFIQKEVKTHPIPRPTTPDNPENTPPQSRSGSPCSWGRHPDPDGNDDGHYSLKPQTVNGRGTPGLYMVLSRMETKLAEAKNHFKDTFLDAIRSLCDSRARQTPALKSNAEKDWESRYYSQSDDFLVPSPGLNLHCYIRRTSGDETAIRNPTGDMTIQSAG